MSKVLEINIVQIWCLTQVVKENTSEEKEEKQIIWNVDFLFSFISINKSDLSDIFARKYSR